jgi:hypothetical protein
MINSIVVADLAANVGKGLPLVNIPPQPEPILFTGSTHRILPKVFTLSRKVDECEPLVGGLFAFNDFM